MTTQNPLQNTPDLFTVSQTLFWAFPLATARQVWGINSEQETAEATWEAYDASVRAATTAIDALYQAPYFSDAVSSTINQVLRWQQMSTAVNSVVWTSLWQTLGLPTAAEVHALNDHLRRLETRLPRSGQNGPARVNRPQLRSAKFSMRGSALAGRRKGEAQKERAAA
jgi:hypothetical protein